MDLKKFLKKKDQSKKDSNVVHPFEKKIKIPFSTMMHDDIDVLPITFLISSIIKCLIKGKELKELQIITKEGELKKISLDPTDTITVILPEECKLELMSYCVLPPENMDTDWPELGKEYHEFTPIEVKDIKDKDGGTNKAYDIFFGDFINALINIIYTHSTNIGFEEYLGLGNVVVGKFPLSDDSEGLMINFWDLQEDAKIRDSGLFPITDRDGNVFYLDINL